MQVVKGVLQRFGVNALTPEERKNPVRLMKGKPNLLKTCVVKLTEMQVCIICLIRWLIGPLFGLLVGPLRDPLAGPLVGQLVGPLGWSDLLLVE